MIDQSLAPRSQKKRYEYDYNILEDFRLKETVGLRKLDSFNDMK